MHNNNKIAIAIIIKYIIISSSVKLNVEDDNEYYYYLNACLCVFADLHISIKDSDKYMFTYSLSLYHLFYAPK